MTTNPQTLPVIDHGNYREPNGYYTTDPATGDLTGDVECAECAENGDLIGAAIEGHEWPELFSSTETDYPVHCHSCEALIATTLTSDGEAWLLEAMESGYGRPEVLATWREAFAYLFTN